MIEGLGPTVPSLRSILSEGNSERYGRQEPARRSASVNEIHSWQAETTAVRDPRQNYEAHSAARRLEFHQLIVRFTIQLRNGCGNRQCEQPACLTNRLWAAGPHPVRRYSPTSSRILAVYMAGCGNPYDRLCTELQNDHIRQDGATARHWPRSAGHATVTEKRSETSGASRKTEKPSLREASPDVIATKKRSSFYASDAATLYNRDDTGAKKDKPAFKDHRSFIAAVFETSAFKTIGWSTPTVTNVNTRMGPGMPTDAAMKGTDYSIGSTRSQCAKIKDSDSDDHNDSRQSQHERPISSVTRDKQGSRSSCHKSLLRLSLLGPSMEPLTSSCKQSVFSIFGDAHTVIRSFSSNGKLLDSYTIWHTMAPLVRSAPELVFHSLWLSAESLLTADILCRHEGFSEVVQRPISLDEYDAGSLMSICLHALFAAMPEKSSYQDLQETSQLLSNGVILPSTHGTSKANAIFLEHSDAFSNDLALRLARRLFLAIAAHRNSMRRGRPDVCSKDVSIAEPLLEPLLSQLGPLQSTRHSAPRGPTAEEHQCHANRMSLLLLDWARIVLATEWSGGPLFAEDSCFGGAIVVTNILHSKRNDLLLGISHFRMDCMAQQLDMARTPVRWASLQTPAGHGHLLDYPYLFSPDSLVSFFRAINFARMSRSYEESSSLQTRMRAIMEAGSLITNAHHKVVLQELLKTASSRYLLLEIGRKNALGDAFDQLWRRERRELLRPLKVHLGENHGEEGFDSGGVQQEFFRMAIAECFEPAYGAFTVDDRTKMAWFTPGSVVELWKYELIGVLFSLALYNGVTLPVTLPRALYRKLLGTPVCELHHVADGWPDLVNGLTMLLEWDEKDGLVEDVFTRTYEFSVVAMGQHVSTVMRQHESCEQGAAGTSSSGLPSTLEDTEAPLVTSRNRDQYVRDYISHLTDISVRAQFKAFERGFKACLLPKSLILLSPETLQSLVEGVQDIDINDLKRHTRYVGWDQTHPTVKDFWSVVKRYNMEMRRRLLEFVTASDRIPVGGMRNLQFVVQKNGQEPDKRGRLPTAYTCYGTLLLPEYADKSILKERLSMALDNAQGFGFA